jgi:hypothetical protein
MLIFFVGTLVCAGLMISYDTEETIKKQTIARLRKEQIEGLRPVLIKLSDELTKNDGLEDRERAAREQSARAEEAAEKDRSPRDKWQQNSESVQKAWADSQADWARTYGKWKEENLDIRRRWERLDDQQAEAEKEIDGAKKDLEDQRRALDLRLRELTAQQESWERDVRETRAKYEKLEDKISSVTRNLETKRSVYPQGRITFSAPEQKWVEVDIGNRTGLQTGMRFVVYSRRFAEPTKKGEILVTEIFPERARGIFTPSRAKVVHDPQTGWETYDETMRYSAYTTREGEKGEGLPQELTPYTSKRDIIRRIRIERLRREEGLTDEQAAARVDAIVETTTPITQNDPFDPIVVGDWIHSPDFIPIRPQSEFRRDVQNEITELRNIKTGMLTFYIAPVVPQYRTKFLTRLIKKNLCQTSEVPGPVDFIITTAATADVGALRSLLADRGEKKEGEEVSPEIQKQRDTLTAIDLIVKTGGQVLSESLLESFFNKRRRKMELLKGKEVQPGQYVFFVAGETERRSIHEIRQWIKERGGITLNQFDVKQVDYLVVGSKAEEYVKIAEDEGIKILRERELDHFFGNE